MQVPVLPRLPQLFHLFTSTADFAQSVMCKRGKDEWVRMHSEMCVVENDFDIDSAHAENLRKAAAEKNRTKNRPYDSFEMIRSRRKIVAALLEPFVSMAGLLADFVAHAMLMTAMLVTLELQHRGLMMVANGPPAMGWMFVIAETVMIALILTRSFDRPHDLRRKPRRRNPVTGDQRRTSCRCGARSKPHRVAPRKRNVKKYSHRNPRRKK